MKFAADLTLLAQLRLERLGDQLSMFEMIDKQQVRLASAKTMTYDCHILSITVLTENLCKLNKYF